MNWKVNKEDNFLNLDKYPIYKKDIESLTLSIKGITFELFLRGVFSIKKRKVFSLGEKKEIYKIVVENLNYEISYIGVYSSKADDGSYTYIYPMLKTNGPLNKIQRKILVAKKHKIDFCIDSDGKLIL